MRLLSLLAAAALIGACAARTPAVSLSSELARADELVRQGCYDCLRDAGDIYERLAATNRRAVASRRLEVELLLALREKELAIDAGPRIAAAAALAADLETSRGAAAVVALVDAIPPDAVGTPRVERRPPPIVAAPGARDTYVREGLAAIARSGFSAPARAYLESTVRCTLAPDTVAADAVAADTVAADTAAVDTVAAGNEDSGAAAQAPLLRYRNATCTLVDSDALKEIRAAVPRFVEAAVFLGRAAMVTLARTDGAEARGLFEEAYARFPTSPSVTFHLATIAQATGDCRRAAELFGETLVLRERHEDARLGRTICRTYLSDPDGAIADATMLVDSGAYNRPDALYWRAWNRRTQKQLELARADIDGARALRYNSRVLTLAGMIEHDQAEFDKAREDLRRARDMDGGECQARWYLGLVGYATENWPEAAAGFADAADCYAGRIAETEAQREAMARRTDVSEEFRARQLAGFNAAIAEDNTQKSAADLNAAINYARADDVANATIYMKRAAVDPERRGVVEDLRQVLGVPRW